MFVASVLRKVLTPPIVPLGAFRVRELVLMDVVVDSCVTLPMPVALIVTLEASPPVRPPILPFRMKLTFPGAVPLRVRLVTARLLTDTVPERVLVNWNVVPEEFCNVMLPALPLRNVGPLLLADSVPAVVVIGSVEVPMPPVPAVNVSELAVIEPEVVKMPPAPPVVITTGWVPPVLIEVIEMLPLPAAGEAWMLPVPVSKPSETTTLPTTTGA